MVKCLICNKEMSQRGRVTSKDEKREIYYCETCNKFYNVFYDIVFRNIEEMSTHKNQN